MLNENRASVMSILKDSESSKKIDCVINTVETASRLIVHAIKILDLSVLKVTSGKAVSLISYFCSSPQTRHAQSEERAAGIVGCMHSLASFRF